MVRTPPLKCKLHGCQSPPLGSDPQAFCRIHTFRNFKHGHPYLICDAPNCTKRARNKGLCLSHASQMKNFGRVLPRLSTEPNEITIDGPIATIHIYNKYGDVIAYALIDTEDIPLATGHKWYLDNRGYIMTHLSRNITLKLHRLIIGRPLTGMMTDHINRNKVDNRRSNLRFCDYSQNGANSGPQKNNKSGYRGVSFDSPSSPGVPWRAELIKGGKKVFRKRFPNARRAAAAYNRAALRFHGDFAYQNDLSFEYYQSLPCFEIDAA